MSRLYRTRSALLPGHANNHLKLMDIMLFIHKHLFPDHPRLIQQHLCFFVFAEKFGSGPDDHVSTRNKLNHV